MSHLLSGTGAAIEGCLYIWLTLIDERLQELPPDRAFAGVRRRPKFLPHPRCSAQSRPEFPRLGLPAALARWRPWSAFEVRTWARACLSERPARAAKSRNRRRLTFSDHPKIRCLEKKVSAFWSLPKISSRLETGRRRNQVGRKTISET